MAFVYKCMTYPYQSKTRKNNQLSGSIGKEVETKNSIKLHLWYPLFYFVKHTELSKLNIPLALKNLSDFAQRAKIRPFEVWFVRRPKLQPHHHIITG